MDLSIAFLLFFCAFSICFFLLLFCFYFAFVLPFFQAKAKKNKTKAKKNKSKKQKKKQQKCKWTSPFFSHVFPFLTFLFFPIYFVSCFFGFEVLLFDFPCVFLFFCFFSSLKNIRISYRGGHNLMTSYDILWLMTSTEVSPTESQPHHGSCSEAALTGRAPKVRWSVLQFHQNFIRNFFRFNWYSNWQRDRKWQKSLQKLWKCSRNGDGRWYKMPHLLGSLYLLRE